ncbi:MAG: hypothetical protein GY859_38535, partial [Desulfobacterales bacterium]|nr:hypothetical protein [Desulfobacterales bacterium]
KAPRLPYSPANRGVLVVVDREPARLRPTAESLLNKYFGEFAAPDLLMMSREGYQTFATLTGDLLVQADESAAAYRSSSINVYSREDERKALERRLRLANEGFDAAAERLKLASVVIEGGFADEAPRPLRQALGWALNTHLSLVKAAQPGEALPSPRLVEAELTSAGGISGDLSARLERVRALTAPPGEGEEDAPFPGAEVADGLMRDIQELIDAGRERVAREAASNT